MSTARGGGADGAAPAAASATAPAPPPPSSSPASLPQHLVHLSTLVLVSRAATSGTSTAGTTAGFTHARQQPLDALSHLLTSYLSLAAHSATQAANLAGRNRVAPWDVVTALSEIGYRGKRGLDELSNEIERGDDGIEEEADQLRQLARGLQDRLAAPPIQPPICQMTYDPLFPSELQLLSYLDSLPAEGASTPSASGADDDASSSSGASSSSALSDRATPPPPPPAAAAVHVKTEPNLASAEGLDILGDLNMNLVGDLGASGGTGLESADDAAFLDSLGLGTSSTSAGGGAGIGDVTASVFHPLDLAGRPIADLSLLGPANLDSLNTASFPGFGAPYPGQLGGPTYIPGTEEEDARPFPAWNDQLSIPAYVPSFFPPFPGMERESPEALARRRRRARERERDALALQTANEQQQRRRAGAAAALMLAGAGGGTADPWAEVIPYEGSSLATMANDFGHSLPTPASPRSRMTKRLLEAQRQQQDDKEGKENGTRGRDDKRSKRTRTRRRSLSPPATTGTSLASFANIQPLIPHEPAFLPPNQLRRSAAGYIAFALQHPELNVSSDSLFGSLPYAAPLRQSTLPPGFLPDFAPPLIHPFNTNLPFTVSNPVPYHPAAPTSILPAAPPNPRLPTPVSSIARELSFPLQFDTRPGLRDQLHPNIALFARLRRIGPPGPLGPKGEALNYEYIGNTALLALSAVDWPERRHNAKLPRRLGDDPEGGDGSGGGGGGEGGAGGVGIKLKLGGNSSNANNNNMQGRQTREGSLFGGTGAANISTPWNTFGASPSTTPFASTSVGGGGADFDLAAFSASLASAPTTIDAFAPINTPLNNGGGGDFSQAEPQADFDYPEFLLSAGGLSSAGGGEGAGEGGGQGGAFDWATVTAPAQNGSVTPAPGT
ncbi:hypothetical protein JCM10908_007355 [Rhodotorula pacifica]|uniref:uncharacterized protein n=1 Tax=Rhodotorula pacifica TaxID=1495444 RepID=UPI00317AA6B8